MGKTLVTGATGFTGGRVAAALVKRGEPVAAFVRATSQTDELGDIGVECRTVDICNRQAVFDNFDDITKVFHIAAAYRTEHSRHDEFRIVNVEATRHLLDAAKAAKVKRFVHCSTVGVQGEIDHPPATEEYRCKPGDHYQQSKLEGEQLAAKYFDDGLKGTIVRPVGIYGPGDSRFLKLFKPISKGYFVMIGTGSVLYHLTYIDDIVQGFLLAGEHPRAVGEVFTIGGEAYTTLTELVDKIASILGKPPPRLRVPYAPVYRMAVLCDTICRPLGLNPPLFPRRVEFFKKDRAFSIEKAKKLLGYSPRIGLDQGLRRTAEWYKRMGMI
jgi:nucleoside-diphosphate-sugar epimerase